MRGVLIKLPHYPRNVDMSALQQIKEELGRIPQEAIDQHRRAVGYKRLRLTLKHMKKKDWPILYADHQTFEKIQGLIEVIARFKVSELSKCGVENLIVTPAIWTIYRDYLQSSS